MAKIDDITKLNPALLEISEAEIDRRITELMMARDHKAKEAERLDREAKLDEAGAQVDMVLSASIRKRREIPSRIAAPSISTGSRDFAHSGSAVMGYPRYSAFQQGSGASPSCELRERG